jgi:hypothetical protein
MDTFTRLQLDWLRNMPQHENLTRTKHSQALPVEEDVDIWT